MQNTSRIMNLFGADIWYLDLSGNNLATMDPAAFKSFTNLSVLYLNNANLTKLIEFPSNLDTLSIANNSLRQLNLSNLHGNLDDLNLEGNH